MYDVFVTYINGSTMELTKASDVQWKENDAIYIKLDGIDESFRIPFYNVKSWNFKKRKQ